MILSDGTIRARVADGTLGIDPFDPERLQPASYDVTLAGRICLPSGRGQVYLNLPFALAPGDFVLASTAETIALPADLIGRIEGRSSWARQGLAVHITAGFLDPGFRGQVTLELANLGPYTLHLEAGLSLAQIAFEQLDAPALRPYGSAGLGSRYQGQRGVTPARQVAL